MRCNMECMAPEKCRFSLCKTDDFVVSLEIGRRGACEGPFDLIRRPRGGQNAFRCGIYSIFWMHKRAAWVDLGPQRLPIAPPGNFRFGEEISVLYVLATDWQPGVD